MNTNLLVLKKQHNILMFVIKLLMHVTKYKTTNLDIGFKFVLFDKYAQKNSSKEKKKL